MTVKKKKERVRHLGIRINESLHARLVSEAIADRRSLTTELLVLLEEALGARRPKG